MMKFFMFSLLACCAVRCDDSNNYYIVQMPADDPPAKTFNVYWNVPTIQCRSRKVLFENLYEKYGIIQNADDKFRGEKITILYEPGLFPAIFKNESSGKYKFRNGGVPQEGDLQEHLLAFRKDMDEIIPDTNFSGVAIIDFESWRPIFRQNFGTLVPYKDVSYEIEKKLHPWWPTVWIQSEAKRRFQEAARKFMQTTISVAKQMRPKALWGYYGFPHCFNMAQGNLVEQCSSDVIKENDQTYWLWGESTALLPSIYRAHDLAPSQLAAMIRGRVGEAARVRRRNSAILPYFWFRYRDSGFISQNDLSAIFSTLYKSEASGFVIWGSSNDVNTLEKCVNLQNYVEKVFGPAIALYTKKSNKNLYDATESPEGPTNFSEVDGSTTSDDRLITAKPNESDINDSTPTFYELKDKLDPEMVWALPTKDTVNLSSSIEEELFKKHDTQLISNDTGDKNGNKFSIYKILMGTLINLRHVSHVDNEKDDVTIQNNNVIKPERTRVESNIQADNSLERKNETLHDRRQYNSKNSTVNVDSNESTTINDKRTPELNKISSANAVYTSTENNILNTSTESVDVSTSRYNNNLSTSTESVDVSTSRYNNILSTSTELVDVSTSRYNNILSTSTESVDVSTSTDNNILSTSTEAVDTYLTSNYNEITERDT